MLFQTGAVTRFTLTEPWLSEGVLRGNIHHEQACWSLHNFESEQPQTIHAATTKMKNQNVLAELGLQTGAVTRFTLTEPLVAL